MPSEVTLVSLAPGNLRYVLESWLKLVGQFMKSLIYLGRQA